MTTEVQHSQSTSQSAVQLDAVIADLKARFARWRLYRRTVAEMAGLSTHDLADLGLHRSELKRVAYMAVYES